MNNTAVKKVKEAIGTENKIELVKETTSEKLSDVAETVHNKSDEVQEFIGEKVESVEDILRKKTYEAGDFTQQKLEEANKLGHRAADLIDNSSKYVKQLDVNETKEQIVQSVKKNPEVGIAIAGVFGLLLGYLVGRKSK